MTVTQDAQDAQDLVGTFTPEIDAAAEPETETETETEIEDVTMRPTEWLQRKLARIPEAKLKSPAVAAKLEQAKADLLALENSISSAAVAAANGDPEPLQDFMGRIEAAKKQVEFWNHAWGAARREDDNAERGRLASVQQAKVNATEQHLRIRRQMAAKISAAIENLVAGLDGLTRASNSAIAVSPTAIDQVAVAHGAPNFALSHRQIADLVAMEMFRVGHGLMTRAGAYPAAVPGAKFDPQLQALWAGKGWFKPGDLENWPSLEDFMREENAVIARYIKGQPMDLPVPVLNVPVALREPEPPKPAEQERRVVIAVGSEKLAAEIANAPPPPAREPAPEPVNTEREIDAYELTSALRAARYFKGNAAETIIRKYSQNKGDFAVPVAKRLELLQALEALPNALPTAEHVEPRGPGITISTRATIIEAEDDAP